MYDTYTRIFTRLGLKFRSVAADTGAIGGTGSHEFQVIADSGEDAIAWCPDSDYAANLELAEAAAPAAPRAAAKEQMKKVPTPGKATCEEVAELLKLPLSRTVKSVALMQDKTFVLLLVRGDHSLNEVKAQKFIGAFRFASEAEIRANLHCKAGYIGPVGAKVRVVADRTVAAMADFVSGANEEGFHLSGVNWGRDLPEPEVADIRNIVEGDRLARRQGHAEDPARHRGRPHLPAAHQVFRGAEGDLSRREAAAAADGDGLLRHRHHAHRAAAIEQGHDERGIVLPRPIAPFEACLVPIGYHKARRCARRPRSSTPSCRPPASTCCWRTATSGPARCSRTWTSSASRTGW
jgi:prolyl-tRNA synthetase